MLDRRDYSTHPCLIPDLRGESFQKFTIKYNILCKFFVATLYQVKEVAFHSSLLRNLFFY